MEIRRHRTSELVVLRAQRQGDVTGLQRALLGQRHRSRGQHGVAHVATGQIDETGKAIDRLCAHIRLGLRTRPQVQLPQRTPFGRTGQREFDHRVESASEGRVEPLPRVGGQDDDAVVGLDPLQQIVRLVVGESVVG